MNTVWEPKLKSIIEFSAHLVASLLRFQDENVEPFPDVSTYTNVLPLSPAVIPKAQKIVLRDHAVKIWNSCEVVVASENVPDRTDLAKSKAFASLILASVSPSTSKKLSTKMKVFNNALIAAKSCLRANLYELADKLLQSEPAAGVIENASKVACIDTDIQPSCVVEYYCLRALLDWKRQRPDLTEYWHKTIEELNIELQDEDVEKLVDLCYEIGQECLGWSTCYGTNDAAKWFERAVHIMDQPKYTHIFACSEIRLNILHGLVRALSRSDDCTHNVKAHLVLEQLRLEYGPKLAILLLSLESYCNQSQLQFDLEPFSECLHEIILSSHLIETNHQLIMHYVHRLNAHSHDHALTSLKLYILQRLTAKEHADRREQAIVSYVTMISDVQLANSTTVLQTLERDLGLFADASKACLSSSAAQAAHVSIWRGICETDNDNSRSLAMSWCQIGLHRIFEAAGEASRAKIERQMISYHLLVSNLGLARQMLEQMTFMQRNNRSSRYLAYCVAIRSDNEAEAQSCLNTITNGHGENDQLLFACIGESIKHGRYGNTARLLQRVLERHLCTPIPGLDLSALLQYMVKTLIQVITTWTPEQSPDPEVLGRLCSLFKHVRQLHDQRGGRPNDHPFVHIHASWFEKHGIELAKSYLNVWPRRYTIDLLDHCSHLGSELSEIVPTEACVKRTEEHMFIRALLYASEARQMSVRFSVEDLPETSYDSRLKPTTAECHSILYRNMFNTFSKLHSQYMKATSGKDEAGTSRSQLLTLVPLALEALLSLNATTYVTEGTTFDEVSLRQFLNMVHELEVPAAIYALLADVVLAFAYGDDKLHGLQIPSTVAVRLLGRIIQALRASQTYDVDQAARWIRCVAQLIFEDIDKKMPATLDADEFPNIEQSTNMLGSVVQEAIALATSNENDSLEHDRGRDKEGSLAINDPAAQRYPMEELQWLSTKLWNMSIDFYGAGQHETARNWAIKAVQVAKTMVDDNGNVTGLAGQLRSSIQSLGWNTSE